MLENRHLEGYGIERGGTVLKLLERRGRDVMPYVRAKLDETIGGWGKDKEAQWFIDLAERKGWWDLWSSTARAATYPKLFTRVRPQADPRPCDRDDLRRERLKALAAGRRDGTGRGSGARILRWIGSCRPVMRDTRT